MTHFYGDFAACDSRTLIAIIDYYKEGIKNTEEDYKIRFSNSSYLQNPQQNMIPSSTNHLDTSPNNQSLKRPEEREFSTNSAYDIIDLL